MATRSDSVVQIQYGDTLPPGWSRWARGFCIKSLQFVVVAFSRRFLPPNNDTRGGSSARKFDSAAKGRRYGTINSQGSKT